MKKYLPYFTLTLLLLLATIWVAPVRATPQAESLLAVEPAAPTSQLYGDLWRRTELYFGSQKPDGSAVTEAEFAQFLDAIVTPRFPDGLTLLSGYGQFRNADDVIVEEQSFVLILLYPREDKAATTEIEEIRDAYKDAFAQESVLRVDSMARVSF